MTRIDPSLLLRRLVVMARGQPVYDERFHAGVNIIRSDNNGCGKSTIANFIFYVLGGEKPRWTPEMLRCDYVYAEVDFSGVVLTLRREVAIEPKRPIAIAYCDLSEAVSNADQWTLHPYNQTEGKKSFSSVLFDAMGLIQAKRDSNSRLTMHQLLRALYVDQISPVDTIFRYEPFDRDDTREYLGLYLCGVFDPEIQEQEERLHELRRRIDVLDGQIKTIHPILANAGQPLPSAKELVQAIETNADKMKRAHEALSTINRTRWTPAQSGDERAKAIASARKLALEARERVAAIHAEIDAITFEIADSAAFVDALRLRLTGLEHSQSAVASLGAVPLTVCPSCYQNIGTTGEPNVCPLCKTVHGERDISGRLFRLRQELSLQLRESEALQDGRARTLSRLKAELLSAVSGADRLSSQEADIVQAVDVQFELGVSQASRELGYLEAEEQNLIRALRLAEAIAEMSQEKAKLAGEVSRLQDSVDNYRSSQQNRQERVSALISDIGCELIAMDIPVEEGFQDPIILNYSFRQNTLGLNGRSNYAASSMVILKSAFHFALLFASLADLQMRYPRFILMDNMEDKGMRVERSQNWQKAIVAKSQSISVRHQIIFATSMLAPELDTPDVVVGPLYSPTSKTLKFAV